MIGHRATETIGVIAATLIGKLEVSDSPSRQYKARRNRACSLNNDCLRTCSLFHGRDPAFVVRLAAEANLELFTHGQTIMTEGETGQTMYFLNRGSVDVIVGPPDAEVVVASLGAGSMFGELSLLGVSNKRTATIRASEFCDCRVLHHDIFTKILKSFPKEREFFQQISVEYWADLKKKTADRKKEEAEHRRRSFSSRRTSHLPRLQGWEEKESQGCLSAWQTQTRRKSCPTTRAASRNSVSCTGVNTWSRGPPLGACTAEQLDERTDHSANNWSRGPLLQGRAAEQLDEHTDHEAGDPQSVDRETTQSALIDTLKRAFREAADVRRSSSYSMDVTKAQTRSASPSRQCSGASTDGAMEPVVIFSDSDSDVSFWDESGAGERESDILATEELQTQTREEERSPPDENEAQELQASGDAMGSASQPSRQSVGAGVEEAWAGTESGLRPTPPLLRKTCEQVAGATASFRHRHRHAAVAAGAAAVWQSGMPGRPGSQKPAGAASVPLQRYARHPKELTPIVPAAAPRALVPTAQPSLQTPQLKPGALGEIPLTARPRSRARAGYGEARRPLVGVESVFRAAQSAVGGVVASCTKGQRPAAPTAHDIEESLARRTMESMFAPPPVSHSRSC